MSRFRVLLVGHGAREASLALAISRTASLIGMARFRNPLIEHLSETFVLSASYDAQDVLACARTTNPDAIMIGPERPIAAGVTDELTAAGFRVCGPTREAARLESDKAYMRAFLARHAPRLNLRYAVAKTTEDARSFFRNPPWKVAVKPVGLTDGKGVRVEGVQLADTEAAQQYAIECLETTAAPVILEEAVDGVEYTLHCVTNGHSTVFFPATYDYSFRHEQDKGKHTGGMGCYVDGRPNLPFMTEEEYTQSCEALRCVIGGLHGEGITYSGVLQGQFFLTSDGLKICEFACRFGDPEAVVLLNDMQHSWGDILDAIVAGGSLSGVAMRNNLSAVATCLVPMDYPDRGAGHCRFRVDEDHLRARGVTFIPGGCERDHQGYACVAGRAGLLFATAASIQDARTQVTEALTAVEGLAHRSDIASPDDILRKTRAAEFFRKQLSQ